MKQLYITLAIVLCAFISCENDHLENYVDTNQPKNIAVPNIGELSTFNVAIDTSSLAETEIIPSANEDYIENNTFSHAINIHFDGSSVSILGQYAGVSITSQGAKVEVHSTAKKVQFNLSGNSDNGSFKIYSEKKFALSLNGININNPTGAAINIQSKKRAYIVLKDGTTNTLSDGTTYTDNVAGEDMKSTIFSEGKMLFSGKGKLRIYGNAKAGISSDDYIMFRPFTNIYVKATAGNAIRGKEGIYVYGGVVNAETSATAAKAFTTQGDINISGGRIVALTSGEGQYDSEANDISAATCIKADGSIDIAGGIVMCKSTGNGGKGITTKKRLHISAGQVKVIIEGTKHHYNQLESTPKGIRSDSATIIDGGDIMVRAAQGQDAIGIESRATLALNAGKMQSLSNDEAIQSDSTLCITNGQLFAYSLNNDAIEAKGAISISGGCAVGIGSTHNYGFRSSIDSLSISGGTVFGLGRRSTLPSSSDIVQPSMLIAGIGIKQGHAAALLSPSGQCIFSYLAPRDYNNCVALISSPQLSANGNYIYSSQAQVQGGTNFNGFSLDAQVSIDSQVRNIYKNTALTISK